jgi:hypothetical protein
MLTIIDTQMELSIIAPPNAGANHGCELRELTKKQKRKLPVKIR